MDRLTRPIGSVKQSIIDSIEKPTFAPKILKKSSAIATRGEYYPSGAGFEYSANEGEATNRYYNDDYYATDHFGVDDHSQSENPEDRLYHRSQWWVQQRNEKLDRDRELKEEEILRECTFRPQIHNAPQSEGLIQPIRRRSHSQTGSEHSYGDRSLDEDGFDGRHSISDVANRQEAWAKRRYS